MALFDYVVIGKGLMGSAAARYLSGWNGRLAIIGPDEPLDQAAHRGVFSSHYDQGRLTRLINRDPVWSEITRQAMGNYSILQERSGIDFYKPVGALSADVGGVERGNRQRDYRRIAREAGVAHEWFDPGNGRWRDQYPALDFPDNYAIMLEPAPAGYVNPRDYVRAQLAIAAQQGATIIRETAVALHQTAAEVTIETEAGNRYTADKVLVAAGAFTNHNNLLPQPLALRAKTETVILGEVAASDAARLGGYPTVTYRIDDPDISDIYMTPPVLYPNGRYYIKMGGNTAADTWPETLEAAQAWFRSGPSDACKPAMARALQNQWPDTHFLSLETKRCIVCYTPSGYPAIDHLNGRLYVAAGGNGTGAAGSDTLGHLAAGMIYDGRWLPTIPQVPFQARFSWETV